VIKPHLHVTTLLLHGFVYLQMLVSQQLNLQGKVAVFIVQMYFLGCRLIALTPRLTRLKVNRD